WEFLCTFDFDWSLVARKRRFRWPLTFYLAGRYCLLSALIGGMNKTDSYSSKIDCQALAIFNQLTGDAAVGLASINLSLRIITIWAKNLYIVVPLVFAILGHWTLILQGTTLSAAWDTDTGCRITHANYALLAAVFIYCMVLDVLVLVLSVIKLHGRTGNSKLLAVVYRDGMIYFLAASSVNIVAVLLMCLDSHTAIRLIFNAPAAVASTV
ncbi:uncharacterized protein LAESUDRAFT_659020, partial [Laetiporus sulphureus 93-53]